MEPLVCTLGDLVEDVVTHATMPLVRGADVSATVSRHRGGSAANTAAVVARLGGRARFIGHVGADETGDRLLADLRGLGVECCGPRSGATGTVVVIVEPDGERTMCSDRRTAASLDEVDDGWLDGVSVLHVPYFSLVEGSLARTAEFLLIAARERGITTSIDPSSVTLLDARFSAMMRRVRPHVLCCNYDEANAIGVDGVDGVDGVELVVVKQGAGPVRLLGTTNADIPTPFVPGPLDTTGAGDAFAAGLLLDLARGATAVDAVRSGQAAASRVVRSAGADGWSEP